MWKNKTLGIIGGMGPLATQYFYKKIIELTDASCDQEHVDLIILNHASMPDRTQLILSSRTDELYEALLYDAKKLESLSVAAIAIPCNTSHLLVDRLQEQISVPIINMIKETVRDLSKDIECVGILATDGTIKSGLYQQSCLEVGIKPYVPSPEKQKLVMKIIYDGIKAGNEIDYNDVIKIEGELSANGCQAAIMACTELSCFKDMYNLPNYYIDAMEVLAKRSIEACGKRVKREVK
ncbi:MAG: aspartate/glutamate racemase family protein [Clostridiales bacterium]|nr:aspartate/glutamate racemase family protein [Clostridiales bacterium]